MKNQEPNEIVNPLPRYQRRGLFLILVAIFLLAVPAFIFYAAGYRYNILDPDAVITSTGGIYLGILGDRGDIYINETQVKTNRLLRRAYYIQNLSPGENRIHVQSPGLQTWVKELTIYPHFVTEAEAFLMPEQPQVRPITEYYNSAGAAIYFKTSVKDLPFQFASTTVPLVSATTTATSTLVFNSEYEFVSKLMASATVERQSLLQRLSEGVSNTFQFAGERSPKILERSSTTATGTVATTTKQMANIRLLETGPNEISAQYVGPLRDIPYYFCVRTTTPIKEEVTKEVKKSGVDQGLDSLLPEAEGLIETVQTVLGRECHTQVTLSTEHQNIYSFDFFPNNSGLVVIHREDGVFVTEIDNRAWQNSQKIYPDTADAVVVANGRIYIEDQDNFLELLTTLIEPN